MDDYRHCYASGPKYPYYWGGKGSKVSRPRSQSLEESTEPREWQWYLSWLVHLELYRWMQRPLIGGWVYQIFLEAHNCQPSLVLPISCGKCYVFKLWDCCWDMAENFQKKNRRGLCNNNNDNDNDNSNTAAQDQALRTNVIKAISNIRTCQCRAGFVENARRV